MGQVGVKRRPCVRPDVRGKFRVGDPVACEDTRGNEFARGLVAYDADAIRRIAGRSTRDVLTVLGYSNGSEVIHRDDLVLLDSANHGADPGSKRSS